jgi:hypothetical protein
MKMTTDKLTKLLVEMNECDTAIKTDLGLIPVENRPAWVARQNMALARKEALQLEYQSELGNQGTYVLLEGSRDKQTKFATLATDYANCLTVDMDSLYTGILAQMRTDCVGRLLSFGDTLDMLLGLNTYLLKLGFMSLTTDAITDVKWRTFASTKEVLLKDIKNFADQHVPGQFWERFITKIPHSTISNLVKESSVIPVVVVGLNGNLLDTIGLHNRTVVSLPDNVEVDRTVVFNALDSVKNKLTGVAETVTVEPSKVGRPKRRLEQ